MLFGEKLAKARKEKGLTQEQLAEMIGVAKSTLTGYEKGNREPDVIKIKKLIKILEIDADYLLGTDIYAEKKDSPTLSTEHQEVLSAYDNADLHDKNLARMALRLPTLKEDTEFGEDTNFKTS